MCWPAQEQCRRWAGGVSVAARNFRAVFRARANARLRFIMASKSSLSVTLPGRPHRDDLLHLSTGRIHAAGSSDNLNFEPRKARLQDRSAAAPETGVPTQPRPAGGGAPDCGRRLAMTEYVIDVHDLEEELSRPQGTDGLTLQVVRAKSAAFSAPTAAARPPPSVCCCGLLVPDGGERQLHWTGDIIREASLIRREAGYMTQKFGFYEDLTVFENLDLVAERLRDSRITALLSWTLWPHGARRPPRSTRRTALRRLEAAARACRLHPAPAEAATIGRADGGRRREGASRVLGFDPSTGRRRAERPRLHAFHGRGRASKRIPILPMGVSLFEARRLMSPLIGASSSSMQLAAMWTPRHGRMRRAPGVEAAADSDMLCVSLGWTAAR